MHSVELIIGLKEVCYGQLDISTQMRIFGVGFWFVDKSRVR
jgi:hypothetical protein